jgi:hypothetical protein
MSLLHTWLGLLHGFMRSNDLRVTLFLTSDITARFRVLMRVFPHFRIIPAVMRSYTGRFITLAALALLMPLREFAIGPS